MLELDALREAVRARGVFIFSERRLPLAGFPVREPWKGRVNLIGASPRNAQPVLPPRLALGGNGRFRALERAMCVVVFDGAENVPSEDQIAKVLGRLILCKKGSLLYELPEGRFLAVSASCWAGLINQAQAAAQSDRPVLVTGESGVGKELMTRLIHALSGRFPFVARNGAEMRGDLAVSELFGHEKGAFTGAVGKRTGAFVEAGRGTLFLDEISEMPEDATAMLLRAIEERKIKPLGSDKEVQIGCRVLAATNRPDKLRQDLFQRFLHQIQIPPLRERKDDIAAAALFIAFREGFQISWHVLEVLKTFDWEGNVRGLERFLIQAGRLGITTTLGIIEAMERSGKPLGEWGREVREELRLGQVEFARLVGIPELLIAEKVAQGGGVEDISAGEWEAIERRLFSRHESEQIIAEILGFILDCCDERAASWVEAKKLYQVYREWALVLGREPLSQTLFGTYLRKLGFRRSRSRAGHIWHGLELVGTR